MSSEKVISVNGVSKVFQTYERPRDRLLQALFGLGARLSPFSALRHRLHEKAKACGRDFWALRDISFDVRRGETVAIIGRNGSGKSTLLQIICGTLQPSSGDVQMNGRVAALLELGSGFNPEFTGRENVYLNAQLYGLSRAQVDERFESIAGFADIGDFVDQPVKTYSSGMMVRLAFAVIAHVDADVLVVDEALAVGDAFFTQKCMRFLREFMKTGTILFVSHDTGSVKSLCSHALWLERGAILRQGSPRDVCDQYLEAFVEEYQGKSTTTRLRQPSPRRVVKEEVDQREKFADQSNLRNEMRVFEFDPSAQSFGAGDAQISDVHFGDGDGKRLSWVVGGEEVTLHISVVAHSELRSPIIGFFVKDRLGQSLFGENTYQTYRARPVACPASGEIEAVFSFKMPYLAKGDYSLCVAVADGTQEDHVQLHWMHDALIFKSEVSSVIIGLVGVEMSQVRLSTLTDTRP